jgi:hypothetical protein
LLFSIFAKIEKVITLLSEYYPHRIFIMRLPRKIEGKVRKITVKVVNSRFEKIRANAL